MRIFVDTLVKQTSLLTVILAIPLVEDPAADSMKGSPRSRSSQRTFEPELEQKSAGARPTENRTGFSPLRAIGNTIPYLW